MRYLLAYFVFVCMVAYAIPFCVGKALLDTAGTFNNGDYRFLSAFLTLPTVITAGVLVSVVMAYDKERSLRK